MKKLTFFDVLSRIQDKDRVNYVQEDELRLRRLKNGFWYAWHEYQSKVEVLYVPLEKLGYWDRRFDVVIAGSIIEHLSDPVSVIGNLAGLANDVVILAFTHIADSDVQALITMNDWSTPTISYTWWMLTRGLYKRVFNNLGFDIEIVTTGTATYAGGTPESRTTIIARRRKSKGDTN